MADPAVVVAVDEREPLPHAPLQPADDDSQLGDAHLALASAASGAAPASGRVLVQPAASSPSKQQAEEETKEQPAQPPAFFRPASIRLHHHTRSTSSVAPSPLSPLPPPSPVSSLSPPTSARSPLRNLFGRNKKNAVLPLPSSPLNADASLTADSPSALEPPVPTPAGAAAEATSAEERTARTQGRQPSAAWSQSESGNWSAAAPTDASSAQLTAVLGFSGETVTEEEEEEEEATRSLQAEEKEPPAAARETRKRSEQRLPVHLNESDAADDERQLPAQQQRSSPSPAQPSNDVAAPAAARTPATSSSVTGAAAVSPADLFPELSLPELPPLPPELARLTEQLLSELSQHWQPEAFPHADCAAEVLVVGESGWEELKAAELERERLRLQTAQAELAGWKAREWRVWKEEERVRRLLAAEEAKLMEETRQREEAAWAQQQQRVKAELDAFDAQQRRLLSGLRTAAVVSVAQLETAASAPSLPEPPAPTSSLPPYPPLHLRYTAVYSRTPRLLSLHIHALRAVKNKLSEGSFSIRVTVLDRLGGQQLRWQGGCAGAYSSQSSTREPQRHGGGWWEQELLFHQPINRLMLACPPDAQTRPAMVLLFELLPAASLPEASASAVSASEAATPSSPLAWGAFPLASFSSSPPCSSSLVRGHHRLPLLLGPVDPGIRSWRQLHRRLSLDLSTWLCNLYFYAERGEDRVEEDRQYCADLSVVRPCEAKQDAGEEKDGEAAAGDDDSSGSSLLSARLRRMDLTHAQLVRDVRRLDGAAAEDVNDPFAVWPQKDAEGWRRLELTDEMERAWRSDGSGDHFTRCLSLEMRTRRKKRKAAGGDAAELQAASSDYLFAVDSASPDASSCSSSSSSSSAPPLSLLRVKLRWLLHHLDSQYQVMQPLSVPCLLLAVTFLLSLWSRLFLHYFAQWIYLASLMPTVGIQCSALSCSFLYSQPLTADQLLLLSIIGTVIPLVLLLLMMTAVWLFHRCSQRAAPALLHTALLCLCACLVLDPFVIDSSSLYHSASSLSTFLAACLSTTSSLLCLVLLYLYLLHGHADGALMDAVVRLHAADSLYLPNDYELCMRDVLSVVQDSRHWTGEMGERRRVTVRAQHSGPVYLSIVTVDAEDEQLEVYRQFALMDCGDVFELFDSRDVTQQQQGAAAAAAADATAAAASEAVSPAAAEAYLASLLKGRRKVADRSAAVLWALVRDKFGFTAARVRGDSRGRGSTVGNGSGGLRMGTFAARPTLAGARLRTHSTTATARLGI